MAPRSGQFCLTLSIIATLIAWLGGSVCGQPSAAAAPKRATGALVDQPIPATKTQLLDLAFQAATAIPVEPHLKTRCRTQEAVADACLQLDQPRRAHGYLKQIANWRRGAALADLALYLARGDQADLAGRYLAEAETIAAANTDWRADRVRVKIGMAHAWLGEAEKSAAMEKDVEEAETGKVARIRAMRCDDATFDAQMKELDTLIGTGKFDVVKNAMKAYAQLYNRFYTDTKRRDAVEKAVRRSWKSLLLLLRIELLRDMAGFSLDHEDPAKALALINEAQTMMDGARWRLAHRLPLTAKLAELRYRAGDRERARAALDAALAAFEAEGESIVNIYRSRSLRPLAEAYHAMADDVMAVKVYKLAVEQGVANPNSRPRAQDLAAVCVSMATAGVEPDDQLWRRIRQIREELGQPW